MRENNGLFVTDHAYSWVMLLLCCAFGLALNMTLSVAVLSIPVAVRFSLSLALTSIVEHFSSGGYHSNPSKG